MCSEKMNSPRKLNYSTVFMKILKMVPCDPTSFPRFLKEIDNLYYTVFYLTSKMDVLLV